MGAPEASAPGQPDDLKVLVVEDDADIRMLLCEVLRELGHVRAVPDAYQAEAWLEAEAVDVLVLDLMLPGVNGVQLLQRLGEQGRSIPTVVVTALGTQQAFASSALEAGARVVLSKPFDPQRLLASVIDAAGR